MPRPTDPTPAAPETEETNGHKPVSRRGVLKRAAVVAAGAGGASLLLSRKAFAVPTAGSNAVYLATPGRLFDSRNITPDGTSSSDTDTRLTANNEVTVQATDPGGGQGIPAGATGIFGNVTVGTPTTGGNIIMYPSDGPTESPPNAVTLVVPNPMAGQFMGNHFNVALSATGAVDVYWQSPSGSTDVIIDVHGYFIDDAAD
jgi:hypothetical protein